MISKTIIERPATGKPVYLILEGMSENNGIVPFWFLTSGSSVNPK